MCSVGCVHVCGVCTCMWCVCVWDLLFYLFGMTTCISVNTSVYIVYQGLIRTCSHPVVIGVVSASISSVSD